MYVASLLDVTVSRATGTDRTVIVVGTPGVTYFGVKITCATPPGSMILICCLLDVARLDEAHLDLRDG